MKILFLKSVVLTAFSTGMAALTYAQVAPAGLTFQGRLTTLSGQPVPNGNAKVRVRIFDAPTAGTRLWTSGEGNGQELTVPVRNGVFSTILSAGFNSSNNPLTIGPTVFQGGVIYVEVQPLNQTPIVPRTQIWSAPWAFWAERVPNDSISSSQLSNDPSSLAKLTDSNVIFSPGASAYLFATRLKSTSLTLDNSPFSFLDFHFGGTGYGSRLRTDGTNRLKVESDLIIDGKLGVGTQDPQTTLDVNGSAKIGTNLTFGPTAAETTVVSAGGIEFSLSSPNVPHYPGLYWKSPNSGTTDSASVVAQVNGILDFYSVHNPSGWARLRANSFEAQSSRRFKKDIRTLEHGLRSILELRPVTYLLKSQTDKSRHSGLIAEEVAGVAPDVVGYEGDKSTPSGIDYSRLTPYLIKAVQEQQSEIQNLRSANEGLSKLNRSLVDRMERIERQLAKLNKH